MKKIKNGLWNDEKAKELFHFIEEQKKNNVPLIKAFDMFAEKKDRKQNSIRNYYYFHLRHLEANPEEAKRLGVTLDMHTKMVAKKFSDDETEQLLKDIESLRKQGNSVRKACLILANNDVSEMIRLQNKVRQIQKKSVFPSEGEKVIQMPQKKTVVSDSEISSLFVGLIKMVQKNAMHLAENKMAVEKQKILDALQQASKNNEKYLQEMLLLKQENKQLRVRRSSQQEPNMRERKLKKMVKALETAKHSQKTASNK